MWFRRQKSTILLEDETENLPLKLYNCLNLKFMVEAKKTLKTADDIQEMVHQFYGLVQNDDLIGPIFNEVIKDNWPAHLEKMVGFWRTILLNERMYSGSPFPPHKKLDIEARHFERWLSLFEKNIKGFSGDLAEDALKRAKNMAIMFEYKINHLKGLS